ncbi:MAG: DUF1684 domain-containing protein [Caldilineaceae bacterium]|nr:DUF1684 domain-containing protein [Caldilineaceae bacterium]
MSTSTVDYTEVLLAQREKRQEQLLADCSWLTVAGLFWLQEGINTIGADPASTVVLTAAASPTYAGTITLHHDTLQLRTASDVVMTQNGVPIQELLLQHDMTPQPTYVTIGPMTLLALKRGKRYAIRLFDSTNPARAVFTGLDWYPIDPALCIVATFTPHEPPRTLAIDSVTGDTIASSNPGAVHFTLAGQECTLEAEGRGSKLFFNFRDLTNHDETYPAGRFLYTDAPINGKVTLDFNQATNPYCAYTPYATCPLPPPANRLPTRIAAGEKRYPK